MPGHYLLDQYKHNANAHAHELYTGPEVERACGGDVDIVAIAMGSGGTVTGVSCHLKRGGRKRIVIGVRPVLGDQVPGTRDERRMAKVVTLPWKRAVDAVAEGRRKASFIAMRQLWSEVEPQPGPSSGLALVGLKRWLEGLGPTDREKLRGKRAVFICPDDGRFYPERTTGELDPDQGLAY
jgi:cysteine synthase